VIAAHFSGIGENCSETGENFFVIAESFSGIVVHFSDIGENCSVIGENLYVIGEYFFSYSPVNYSEPLIFFSSPLANCLLPPTLSPIPRQQSPMSFQVTARKMGVR
jgi:hypothetical protein